MNPNLDITIEQGIRQYYTACRARVPHFVKAHYSYPGCWRLNRNAFGWDILRAPFNLLWAPIYIAVVLSLLALGKLGFISAQHLAGRIPGGIETKVQQQTEAYTRNELLCQNHTEHSMGAAISSELGKDLEIAKCDDDQTALKSQLNSAVDDALKQLLLTRTASADISNTIISTTAGALLFKKFTPGGIGIGLILATIHAQHRAESNFWLGDRLGSVWYSWFSPEPALLEAGISVLVVMLVLSVIASFSGLFLDPLQARIGLHRYRLKKMLSRLEKDTLSYTSGGFRPVDPYVARLLEIVDAIKSPLAP